MKSSFPRVLETGDLRDFNVEELTPFNVVTTQELSRIPKRKEVCVIFPIALSCAFELSTSTNLRELPQSDLSFLNYRQTHAAQTKERLTTPTRIEFFRSESIRSAKFSIKTPNGAVQPKIQIPTKIPGRLEHLPPAERIVLAETQDLRLRQPASPSSGSLDA